MPSPPRCAGSLHRLVKAQPGRIDLHGVLCLSQRLHGPVHILFIPLFQILQHLLIGIGHALLRHFLIASAGALLRAGGQIDLGGRVRQHGRADIPPVEHHICLRGQLLLQPYHPPAHVGIPAHSGCGHADLRRADQAGHVLSFHQGPLPILPVLHAELKSFAQLRDLFFVTDVNSPAERGQSQRPVHRPGVQMQDPQPGGHRIGYA